MFKKYLLFLKKNLYCSINERYSFDHMYDKNLENNFKVLRGIQNNPKFSQRKLAKELGFSLGKLNYCIKALKQKGLVKINNFNKNPNKITYAYILTPKGIKKKASLTFNFMIRKMKEYDQLKKELAEQKRKSKNL